MLCPSCFLDKGGFDACHGCGFEESPTRSPRFLPYRQRLSGGRYVIGRVLGKPGGFGAAYKALDNHIGAIVVIKECLLTDSGQVWRKAESASIEVSDSFGQEYWRWLARFRREAITISRFNNPCVVRVIDVFEENNTAYYVMPFIDSEDLAEYCAQRGHRLPEEEVSRIAVQLLSVLSQIHAAGVVHRDIKPSNVLITRVRRKPILIDFGAACTFAGHAQSRAIMTMQSPDYSPMEQVLMRPEQGPWTDLYSLCATLHFCLVGEPPPRASDRFDLKGLKPDPFTPLHKRLPSLDRRLASVIDTGLAILPRDRMRDAATAIRILTNYTPQFSSRAGVSDRYSF